ncbi:MAG: putative outer membrane protein [Parcubacteria group bacterium GW2011_GWC2_42_12]|nr:MAG: putative outer membrane protein [Parcubacteria group bacterium GW2011_GWC2_42_12]
MRANSKNFKFFLLLIAAIILTLGLSISGQSLLAEWTAPVNNPPACIIGNPGCDAPVNVSATPQIKAGALWLNTNVVSPYGLIVENGKVGIGLGAGVFPDVQLQVNGGGLTGSGINDVLRLSGGTMTTVNDATGLLFIQRDVNNDYGAAIRLVNTQSTPAWLNPRLDFAVQNPDTNTQANIGVKMSILGNGNVGIGTTGPSTKLEVAGSTEVPALGTAGGTFSIQRSDNALGLFAGSNAAGDAWMQVQRTDSANAYNLLLQPRGGNVGIGTANPNFSLHVHNPITGANLQLTDYASGVSPFDGLRIGVGASGVPKEAWLWFQEDGDLKFGTNNGEKMRILSNGNVGIGTASPSEKLEVRGTIWVSELTQNKTIGYFSGAGASTPTVGIENVNGGGGIALRVSNLGGAFGDRRAAEFISDGGVAGYFNSNGGATALIVDQGNVGIGTANPGAKLEVAGQVKITGGTLGAGRVLTSDASGLASWVESAGGSQWTTATPNIYYNTGNVGIGTAAPNASLHISNANPAQPMMQFTDTWVNVGSQNRIMLQGYNSFTSFNTWKILSGGAGYFRNVFVTNDGGITTPIRLSPTSNSYFNVAGANIGIGTDNPNTKLNIYDSASGPIINLQGLTTNYRGVRVADTANAENWFSGANTANNYVIRRSGSFDDITINSLGNVGIGTANPLSKFNVEGDIRAGRAIGGNFLAQDSGGAVTSVIAGLEDENSYINNGGNFGIGLSNPGAFKLNVQGTARISGNLTVGDLTIAGADVAEEFSTPENYEAGTVLVMGDNGYRSAKVSYQPYDHTVIGVVSDNPAIIMGKAAGENKAIVAIVGVIKVKVTDSNGKIRPGDLLTTSATAGYAMKATENKIGTIIGKALEDLKGERGEIMVLVNLQ